MPIEAAQECKFQSTPLIRGATQRQNGCQPVNLFQSTPPIRGTPELHHPCNDDRCFNPRPHTRGDIPTCRSQLYLRGFNPRPKTRGDSLITRGEPSSFNPRPPYEGRLTRPLLLPDLPQFQSTPLYEGRHIIAYLSVGHCRISIHAPNTRGDSSLAGNAQAVHVSIHAPLMRATISRIHQM